MSTKDRSSSSKSSSASKTSSSSSKAKTADELREQEHDAFIEACLKSHGGYLTKPVMALAASLDTSILSVSYALGGIYLFMLLYTPVFLLPHLSALVTLIIPVQLTRRAIAVEQTKGAKEVKDAPQLLFFWVVWCVLELARGWVGIWRPGWKAMYEVIRTASLITVGGPWFGRAGLRPDGPSEELKKLEKAEADAAEAKRAKEEAAEAKKEKTEGKEKEKEKKEKDKERAVKEKERDKKAQAQDGERAKQEKDTARKVAERAKAARAK